MRKVIYSQYVKTGTEEIIGKNSYEKKPTWELQEQGEALFHQWGNNSEVLEDGVGTYSTAIIELEDGTVKNIPVEQVRFISGPIKAKGE